MASQPASSAGGGINDNAVINNLINNNGSTSRSSSTYGRPARETSPLLAADAEGRPARRNRYLSLLAQLLGAAVLAAALLFGVLAFRKGGRETVPWPEVEHPLKPTAIWGAARAPYPTGAWWLNLVLEKGDNNVAVLPYAIQATDDRGVEISYSYFRHLTSPLVEADLFAPDFRFASVENVSEHFVESYDALSVSLVFKAADMDPVNVRRRQAYYRTHLVRGCPYITVEYEGATPVIEPPNMVTVINGLQLTAKPEFEAPHLTESIFDITVISGQQWMLFANPPITLEWQADGGLVALGPYHGYLRIALASTAEVRQVLVDHWHSYPTGGEVLLDTQQETMVTYQWHKKGNGPLLMLALPHHVGLLQGADVVHDATGVYNCLKGPMTAIRGDRWFLKESVPKIRWTAPRPISDDKVSAVRSAVKDDLIAFQTKPAERWNKSDLSDPYWAGKSMSMLARIALVADELGMEKERDEAVALAEHTLEPWLAGKGDNPFLYDRTWGGVVIQNGLKDPYVNFGNTYYNDHHFQYGYFAYAGAVIAKFDPGFLGQAGRKAKLDAIVHDIANYDVSSRFFPLARHKDFYDGHSWASGLFVQNNGKSQESSSEAINAYYGASLYGEATGDKRLEKFASLLLAMEIRSTKFYWHMRSNSSVYDPGFSANKMVGVVGALDVTCQTWFGTNFVFVHGINFMPFTPITEAYLDHGYVEEEYPVMSSVLIDDPPEEGWRGFVILDHAIIDKEAAWKDAQTLKKFDSGNSQTNSLYWVATRPDPPTAAKVAAVGEGGG